MENICCHCYSAIRSNSSSTSPQQYPCHLKPHEGDAVWVWPAASWDVLSLLSGDFRDNTWWWQAFLCKECFFGGGGVNFILFYLGSAGFGF